MNEKVKILIGILLLLAAGTIVFISMKPENNYKGLENKTYWLKCNNAKCANTWSMSAIAYLEYEKKNTPAGSPIAPLAICPKCSQKTGEVAIKCSKCGEIYVQTYGMNDEFGDRCPKCKYSPEEQRRKDIDSGKNK